MKHVADNGAALLQDTAWRRAPKEQDTTTVGAWLVPLLLCPERAFQLSVTSTFDIRRGSASAGMCTAACSPFPFSMVPPAREAQQFLVRTVPSLNIGAQHSLARTRVCSRLNTAVATLALSASLGPCAPYGGRGPSVPALNCTAKLSRRRRRTRPGTAPGTALPEKWLTFPRRQRS